MGKDKKDLPPKLKSTTDYRVWSKLMKLHFIRHGNWGIVSGTELRPKLDQKEEVDKFERRNAGALADLLLCLTGKIRDLALEYDNVSEACK